MSVTVREVLQSILLHTANAVILFVILRFLVYKPVRKFMQARAQRIADSLEQAEQARAQGEQLRAEQEQRLAQAEDVARARALEITEAANTSAKAMDEAAKQDAAALLGKARAAAQAEHDKALAGLRGEVIDLATGMAEQILRQNMNAQDTLRMAQDYFAAHAPSGGDEPLE